LVHSENKKPLLFRNGFLDCLPNKENLWHYKNQYYFLVVSVAILEVSADIVWLVSAAIGAAVVSVATVVVVSVVVSVDEEPPLQAAKNAETQTIINNFFILINLDFL
jgi:hypothetical protein